MNKEENEKFNKIIIDGLDKLIKERPKYPIKDLITYLYNTLPENYKNNNNELKLFCEKYNLDNNEIS